MFSVFLFRVTVSLVVKFQSVFIKYNKGYKQRKENSVIHTNNSCYLLPCPLGVFSFSYVGIELNILNQHLF